VRDFSETWPY